MYSYYRLQLPPVLPRTDWKPTGSYGSIPTGTCHSGFGARHAVRPLVKEIAVDMEEMKRLWKI